MTFQSTPATPTRQERSPNTLRRTNRTFAPSDALRDQLAALGVEVRDTMSGQETTVRST